LSIYTTLIEFVKNLDDKINEILDRVAKLEEKRNKDFYESFNSVSDLKKKMNDISDRVSKLEEKFKIIKKGFKICRYNNRKEYTSAFHSGKITKYKLNEWIERESDCGSLAVFDTLLHVKRFLGCEYPINNAPYHVFQCEYEESKVKKIYYTNRYGDKITLSLVQVPEGTIFADRVKLIKEIDI